MSLLRCESRAAVLPPPLVLLGKETGSDKLNRCRCKFQILKIMTDWLVLLTSLSVIRIRSRFNGRWCTSSLNQQSRTRPAHAAAQARCCRCDWQVRIRRIFDNIYRQSNFPFVRESHIKLYALWIQSRLQYINFGN